MAEPVQELAAGKPAEALSSELIQSMKQELAGSYYAPKTYRPDAAQVALDNFRTALYKIQNLPADENPQDTEIKWNNFLASLKILNQVESSKWKYESAHACLQILAGLPQDHPHYRDLWAQFDSSLEQMDNEDRVELLRFALTFRALKSEQKKSSPEKSLKSDFDEVKKIGEPAGVSVAAPVIQENVRGPTVENPGYKDFDPIRNPPNNSKDILQALMGFNAENREAVAKLQDSLMQIRGSAEHFSIGDSALHDGHVPTDIMAHHWSVYMTTILDSGDKDPARAARYLTNLITDPGLKNEKYGLEAEDYIKHYIHTMPKTPENIGIARYIIEKLSSSPDATQRNLAVNVAKLCGLDGANIKTIAQFKEQVKVEVTELGRQVQDYLHKRGYSDSEIMEAIQVGMEFVNVPREYLELAAPAAPPFKSSPALGTPLKP